MITDQNRLHYLLQRYAGNACTKQEMEELFTNIREARHNAEVNNFLQETWNNIRPGEPISFINWDTMFQQVINTPAILTPQLSRFAWLKVAAVFFIVACSAAIIYYAATLPQTKQVAQNTNRISDTTKPNHKLITLPDGSTVLLNNNSKLHFPQSFSGNTREVTLSGEAYFDIEKDPSKPFIIHTGKVKTVVLGTAFNIRAYPDESAVTVTVARGKVKVETEKKILGIILPNQQISFNTSTRESIQNEVLAESVIIWKQKDMVFDNITFAEAADMISKRYGVEINFANSKLKNCRFNASFLNENQIEQVLKVICDLNKANYTLNNKSITISGEGCD
jgi:ferric-dicitrate binding protein FerR (iron transport regulator)